MSRCLLLTLTLAAATLAFSCGEDSGGQSTDGATDRPALGVDDRTYFQQLEDALAEVNAQLLMLGDLREEAFGGGGDANAAAAYGDAYEQFMTDRDAAVQGITAPETLADEHAALGTATGDTLEFGRQLNDELQSNPPANESGFVELFYELDGANITQRLRDACTRLQVLATNNDIVVDLGCLL